MNYIHGKHQIVNRSFIIDNNDIEDVKLSFYSSKENNVIDKHTVSVKLKGVWIVIIPVSMEEGLEMERSFRKDMMDKLN